MLRGILLRRQRASDFTRWAAVAPKALRLGPIEHQADALTPASRRHARTVHHPAARVSLTPLCERLHNGARDACSGRRPSARHDRGEWVFELPDSGPEPLLKALIDAGVGIETLAIERPGLHEAFVAIAGDATARAMGEEDEACCW